MEIPKLKPEFQKQLDDLYANGRRLMSTPFLREHAERAARWEADEMYRGAIEGATFQAGPCESPLEAAFVLWWQAFDQIYAPGIRLETQVAVEVEGRGYRVDIVLQPTERDFITVGESGLFSDLARHPLCPRIGIELDGHDFHERTKEQVTLRNQRDRVLESAGWRVLHFSGSEFHKDPLKVIEEACRRTQGHFAEAMVALGKWDVKRRQELGELYSF
jgi:hypothetical protein